MKASVSLLFLILLFLSIPAIAQTKKNRRPDDTAKTKIQPKKTVLQKSTPVYFYQFEKPEFLISKIRIEHDQKGVGRVIFQKKDFVEDIVESLQLSSATKEKLESLWTELNFLESKEDYQSKRDYAHLGTMKISMKMEKASRTAEFNWTENAAAKALVEEYRKIGNKYVWMFDINTARQNQPLESPRLMRALDSHLRRNAIADPEQMIPFLKELSEDERIPLISRNHATRLLKKIEKSVEKENKEATKEI